MLSTCDIFNIYNVKGVDYIEFLCKKQNVKYCVHTGQVWEFGRGQLKINRFYNLKHGMFSAIPSKVSVISPVGEEIIIDVIELFRLIIHAEASVVA